MCKRCSYNSFSEIDELDSKCLPNTRIDLLKHIREWATTSAGKCVFWLNGMAGTGKSTIARTLAAEFDDLKQLGASFFFKNGEGDRGKASCLFTTIAAQLVLSVPEIRPLVRKAIEDDPNLADKALRPQFEQLVLYPLQKVKNPARSFILIVIDALDECDNKDHVKTIVKLLSQLQRVQTMSVRTLITSRPELPPRLGFQSIEKSAYQDFILHKIEEAIIGHDIALFLEYKFQQIRSEAGITAEWPGKNNIEELTAMAIPLFIFAATVCRFIGHPSWDPRERLTHVLEYQGKLGLDQMDRTYKPILDCILDGDEEHNAMLVQKLRNVVGPMVVLADHLPVNSLASLLQMDSWHVSRQLDHLHSVLDITDDLNRPIRPLHLSFPNYLLDARRRNRNQFWIDETAVHRHLAYKCIELLRSSKLLKQDVCGCYDSSKRPPNQRNVSHSLLIPTLTARHETSSVERRTRLTARRRAVSRERHRIYIRREIHRDGPLRVQLNSYSRI